MVTSSLDDDFEIPDGPQSFNSKFVSQTSASSKMCLEIKLNFVINFPCKANGSRYGPENLDKYTKNFSKVYISLKFPFNYFGVSLKFV